MARGSNGGNCVAFARDVTGIHLDGNAAMWWPNAQGRYERGNRPSLGAILVFRPHGRMRVGHVAVVSRVVSPREVLVDQANWVRGRVTKAMSVVDASPLNDWTSVKVLEPHSGTHGRENPTFGFIYPRVLPASFGETTAEPQPQSEHRQAARAAHDAERTARDDARHDRREAERADTAKAPTQDRHDKTRQAAKDKSHDKAQPERTEIRQVDAKAPATDKDRHKHADTQQADTGKPSVRLAADTSPHHSHKPTDAKLAYVY